MAHKVLIDGTAYGVKGGKTRVNGTTYAIKKGRTRINGTGYDIEFAQLITIQIDVVSNYYSTAVVSVNGSFVKEMVYDEGIGEKTDYVTVKAGDEINILFDYIGGSFVTFDGCTGISNFHFINDNEFSGTIESNGKVFFTIN